MLDQREIGGQLATMVELEPEVVNEGTPMRTSSPKGRKFIAAVGSGIDTVEEDANAHLIAAAPDLLEACEALSRGIAAGVA